MKLFVALLFLPALLVAQTNPDVAFHSNGIFAQVITFNNGTDIALNVSRGTDSSGTASTFLMYNMFTDEPDSFSDTFGFGTIPDGSFLGDDPAHLTLNVDTSQLSGFVASTCTFSFVSFTQSCSPAAVGLIHVEWQQNRVFTMHEVSDVQQTFLQIRVQEHTEADVASSTASGSIVGSSFQDAGGQAGVNHNSGIQIFRF